MMTMMMNKNMAMRITLRSFAAKGKKAKSRVGTIPEGKIPEGTMQSFPKISPQVTQRTLSVLLLELRRLDVDREGVLAPSLMDQQFEKYCRLSKSQCPHIVIFRYRVPIAPCLPFLHRKFRDPVYIGKLFNIILILINIFIIIP